jgi:hypothetical protein
MSSPLSGSQFTQLQMFDSAENLSKMKFGDTRPGENNAAVMARKLKESKLPDNYSPTAKSLHESIKQHGVLDPVTIVHGNRPKTNEPYSDLAEGHHRIASAHNINPKMIVPVEHKTPRELWEW